MRKLKAVRKLIAACVGLAVTLGLLDAGLAQQIGAVLTAAAVYAIPNE